MPLPDWGQKRQHRLKPAATINTQKQGFKGQTDHRLEACATGNTQKQGFRRQGDHRLEACATKILCHLCFTSSIIWFITEQLQLGGFPFPGGAAPGAGQAG